MIGCGMRPERVSFIAGAEGEWRILRVLPLRGQGLPAAARLTR
jgi:hypothetical protein